MSEKLTDYQRGLEAVKNLPKFYLGQEVSTEFGNGIIVDMAMSYNGLYIEPEKSTVAVWYSTDRAVEESTGWVSHVFKLNEIQDMEKAELIKSALKIVDELGKMDINDIQNDEDSADELDELIEKAKKLRKNKFWKLT